MDNTTHTYQSLRLERPQPDVAEVVLTGPGKGNAMGPDFWREMPEVFATLDADESVRAIIVRGDGKNFSYGLDVPAMMGDLGPVLQGEQLTAGRTRLLEIIERMQLACERVAACRKPAIASVSGYCIGGGLDLASACDVRVCSADAKFSLREVKLAMVADIGSLQRLPGIVGRGHAREMAFTGRDVDAPRAERMGLVSEVLATPEECLARARGIAREIADNPPLAVQGIKRVMNHCENRPLGEGLHYVALWNAAFLQSRDLLEALTAFVEKRKPTFRGE